MKDKKSLIIYFSRADENYFGGTIKYIDKGNTEVIAEYIKNLTGADMFKVEPLNAYSPNYRKCIEEAKERTKNHHAPIKENVPDISSYEVIYVGSPIYWGGMPEELFSAEENEVVRQRKEKLLRLKSEEGYDKLSITFRSKLEELSEYVVVIKAHHPDEDNVVRYYTRVVVENNFHAAKLLEFVERFNNAIFDKQQAENVISKSIEPNEEGNNDYLSHVNIHSSFETITFAELNPSRITKPVAAIKEIDDSYAIIQLKYLISATENKVLENFFVTEDYRVRYVDEMNVYLLDYNRSQEEVFTTDNINTTANSFKLGILDQKDFQCVTSDDQHKAAFVQTRQLWYYDYDSGLTSNVFGFCQSTNYTDPRASYDENNIRILRMDNSGNISFAVYGYMNSGKYEGKVGIAVYRYIADKSRVDELLFIENDKPYNILKEDMETLMYLNKDDEFFYFDHDCVMKIDTKELKAEIFIEDILNENLAVSTDNHLIGYPNALHIEDTTKVTVLNLDDGKSREIAASGTERFRAIGFVQQDLVLGRIKESDIFSNSSFFTFPSLSKRIFLSVLESFIYFFTESSFFINSEYSLITSS